MQKVKSILILNWRDPKSPLEGGAERITQKYGDDWARKGHKVTWVTNSFIQSNKTETINGVEYIRIGPALNGTLSNYLLYYPIYLFNTLLFLKKYLSRHVVDVIIDEIHGLPFFSPLLSKNRIILLVCEVAGPIWDKMFPYPLNVIGRQIEKQIYQHYKNVEIWAISENTKRNINTLLPGKEIKLLQLGVDKNEEIMKKIEGVKKTEFLSAVFLARHVKMKGIESALWATKEIIKQYSDFKLFLIGDVSDSYKTHLNNLVNKLKIKRNVEFLGKVSEVEKFTYLKKSHFLLHPSYREGFGLTILEAALVGTPAIFRRGAGMDALLEGGLDGYLFDNDREISQILISNYQKKHIYKRKTINNHTWEVILKNSQHIL